MATTVVITDPTGELNNGLPTYHWQMAPDGLATRRQLSAKGLRRNRQDPVAQIRRGQRLYAYLYSIDRAAPKRPFTEAKRRAVMTAARSRRRCTECENDQLDYIPRFGVCWDCRGLPAREDASELTVAPQTVCG